MGCGNSAGVAWEFTCDPGYAIVGYQGVTEDYIGAIRFFQAPVANSCAPLLPQPNPDVSHEWFGVKCDGCGAPPIVAWRYRNM